MEELDDIFANSYDDQSTPPISSRQRAIIKLLGISIPLFNSAARVDLLKLLEYAEDKQNQLEEAQGYLQVLEANCARLSNSDTSDMKFIVNNTPIPAHSTIVALWSTPLFAMLTSTMQEGQNKQIEITDQPLGVVQDMVKFFYAPTTNIVTSANAIPLAKLSSLYDIPNLRDKCCSFLLKSISVQNCIETFCVALLYVQEHARWEALLAASRDFISENQDEITVLHGAQFANDFTVVEIMMLQDYLQNFGAILADWARNNLGVQTVVSCLLAVSAQLESISSENQTKVAWQSFYDYCQTALINSYENIAGEDFLQLSAKQINDIIKSDNLGVSSEYVVLESVVRVIQKSNYSPTLLEHVRFPYISIADMQKVIQTYPQIATVEKFRDSMIEATKLQFSLINMHERQMALKLRKHTKPRTNKNYKLPEIHPADFVALIQKAVFHIASEAQNEQGPSKKLKHDTDETK